MKFIRIFPTKDDNHHPLNFLPIEKVIGIYSKKWFFVVIIGYLMLRFGCNFICIHIWFSCLLCCWFSLRFDDWFWASFKKRSPIHKIDIMIGSYHFIFFEPFLNYYFFPLKDISEKSSILFQRKTFVGYWMRKELTSIFTNFTTLGL